MLCQLKWDSTLDKHQILLGPGGPIIYQTAHNRFLGLIIAVGLRVGISPSEDRCLGVKNVVTTIEREVVLARGLNNTPFP